MPAVEANVYLANEKSLRLMVFERNLCEMSLGRVVFVLQVHVNVTDGNS